MNERLVTLAKDFLRGYLTPGEWFTPSQLEDDILGGPDVSKLFMGRSRAQLVGESSRLPVVLLHFRDVAVPRAPTVVDAKPAAADGLEIGRALEDRACFGVDDGAGHGKKSRVR